MMYLRAASAKPLFVLGSLLTCTVLAEELHRDAGHLYMTYCAACHGDNMRGGKAGSLVDPIWRYGDDDESVARSIRDGVAEAGMPGFANAIDDAELRALVVLIRESAARTESPEMYGSLALPADVQENGGQLYAIERWVDGLEIPWSIAFLPYNAALVTEKIGRLRLIVDGVLVPEPIVGVPDVWPRDEGGLMCVAVDPDYDATGWIYLTFSDPGDDDAAMLKVIRARLRDHELVDHETIFAIPRADYPVGGMNFGGRLAFDGPYLYITVGERGRVGEAQDLAKANGKVHRVFKDGSIPADNPFVETPGAVASIWSYGNRNPQGIAIDPRTGDVWATEHGPRGGDELNHIHPGSNYGWPVITHGMNYDGTPISALTELEGLEQPVVHWTPSIAVSPILFYAGDRFPAWKDHLFVGSLGQQEFLRFQVVNGEVLEESRVFKNLGRVRDIQTGPDGLIYIALHFPGSPEGAIIRLVPVEDDPADETPDEV